MEINYQKEIEEKEREKRMQFNYFENELGKIKEMHKRMLEEKEEDIKAWFKAYEEKLHLSNELANRNYIYQMKLEAREKNLVNFPLFSHQQSELQQQCDNIQRAHDELL